jgi:hypothetical protein
MTGGQFERDHDRGGIASTMHSRDVLRQATRHTADQDEEERDQSSWTSHLFARSRLLLDHNKTRLPDIIPQETFYEIRRRRVLNRSDTL